MRISILCSVIIFLCFSITTLKGQDFPKSVCGLDTACDPHELNSNNSPFEENSELHTYLEDIKKIFNQPFARYNLRKITTSEIAAAHLQRIDQNPAARVITINDEYYTSKTNTNIEKKAILIWVMAHEVQHHTNGDLHYDQKIVADNLKKEFLADERAGYAVSKLTDAKISFFPEILPKILYPNEDSDTHPPRKYRILAAQAGWIRAKLEDTNEVTIDGTIYKKEVQTKGHTFWGQFSDNKFNGIGFTKYDSQSLYFGEKKNDLKDGIGCYIFNNGENNQLTAISYGDWKDDDQTGHAVDHLISGTKYVGSYKSSKRNGHGSITWESGNKYVGEWIDDDMTGYGIKYYTNGSIYRGFWKNDEKHGDGVLYKGKEIIKVGCWEEGVYKGQNCDKSTVPDK